MQAFLGAALLATSAFCTALCIVSGLLLSLAWVGVVVYTVLGKLSVHTAACSCVEAAFLQTEL